MLRPVRNDLLLAPLAPGIRTTFRGALQVLRLVEPLFVEVTGLAAPTALQENKKFCQFHLDPPFVLLLRGTNVEHQIPRNLPNRLWAAAACPRRTRWTQDWETA